MPYSLIRGDTQSLVLPCSLGGVPYVLQSGSNYLLTVKSAITDPDSSAICQKAYGAGISAIGPTTLRADFVPIDFYYQTAQSFHFDVQAQEAGGAIHTVALDIITLYTDVTLLTGISVPVYTTNPPYPGGTTLTVTGSNWLTSGALSGIGGTIVYLSGNTIFISGGAGGGGGGITQGQLDSLSGFTVGASGALQSQITAANGTQVRVSGSATLSIADFSGLGGTLVFWSGGHVYISGASGSSAGGGITQAQLDSLSGWAASAVNLQSTGSALLSDIIGLSGQTAGTYATIAALTQTGVAVEAQLSSLSGFTTSLSGVLQAQLLSTGNTLYADLTGASGQFTTNLATVVNLAATGQTLYVDLTGLSGQAVAAYATISNLTQTGVLIEGQLTSLSGWVGNASGALNTLLNSTGNLLYADITGLSGQAVSTYATITSVAQSGSNLYITLTGLSGQSNLSFATIVNLTQTGVLIEAQLASLSGFTLNLSGALQALIVGGGGTAVKVTGGAALVTANFTGIGGTIVFTSGGLVFISGGAGGGGGGVPSVNSITSAVTIAGTGGLTVTTVGQTILVSGDPSISGVVAATGTNLYNLIIAESGALAFTPFRFGLSLDAGTGVVATGLKGVFQLSAGMRISGWNIAAYQTGILLVDINRSTLATFPVFTSIITGSGNYPYISGTATGVGVSLSGWSSILSPGDYLEFYVRGCTGISKFNINITGIKA